MEAYATALLYAIPGFSLLVLLETLYIIFVKKLKVNHLDIVSSLSSGVTNIIKDSLGIVLILISYPWLVEHFALVDLSETSITWVALVAFVAYDFASYWNHYMNHKINIFWNRHVVHHSSEEFNLPCALRQSISVFLGFFAIFLIPAALLGVPDNVIAIIAPIHLFMQFWYHTVHIPKLGFLEYIIVTPSQHRVHHAINPEYIDKNLSAIFCVWDRMFGTFQEELDDVPPVYGVLKPVETWNPILINFQHAGRILQDAWRTKDWKAKFTIWFKPTGWRPADVAEKYPRPYIEDVYHFEKYNTDTGVGLIFWSYFQLVSSVLLMMYLFYSFGKLDDNFNQLLLYGFLVFAGIYGYTTMMDGDKNGQWIELVRSLLGLLCIYTLGSWFYIDQVIPFGTMIVAAYFFITIIGSFYFARTFKTTFTTTYTTNTESR